MALNLVINKFDLAFPAISCIAMIFVYVESIMQLSRKRKELKVAYPKMTGPEEFEFCVRAQYNILEYLSIYFVGLFLFSVFINPKLSLIPGLACAFGRLLYLRGYAKSPKNRLTGFLIFSTGLRVLLFGGIIGILRVFLVHFGVHDYLSFLDLI
eukprot:TRINITY_DN12016_c0_g1_i1.p1 TRINITY_DN12016_c0_g1~~TRINITY_DN12016_c0_g1_i1.p1  ORF type:complete len:154 (-),score=10.99 TRINITY_DN12016_c0_g1_i1:86-547(-)